MINIGDLLGAYSKIKNPLDDKRVIVDIIEKNFNLKIEENQVFFRKNLLILKVNSVQKNYLHIRRDVLLKAVKESVPDRFINNINF
jgi:hypothetical protein